tara:strand:- start:3893 stop:14779 length:10887 start_codon:yes stop_codon:yes gene_type:complete
MNFKLFEYLINGAAMNVTNPMISRLRTNLLIKKTVVYLMTYLLVVPIQVLADLPVPCSGGSCGGKAFVELGNVSIESKIPSNLTINQRSEKAYLNWQSFDIAKGNTVEFKQISNNAVALNKIHDQNPSQILGNLKANGHVYLLNGSGVMFGEGAQINVGSLLATSLDIDKSVFESSSINARFVGVANNEDGNTDLAALFKGDDSLDGASIINKGAIETTQNGNVLLVAPTVTNEGSIKTEDGQVILAGAKDRLYIIPSTSSELRGFIVEIGGDGGVVTNEQAAEIYSQRGNITLLASQIHQKGKLTSSTDTNWAGSVFLLGRDHADNFVVENGEVDFRPNSASADSSTDTENLVRLYDGSSIDIKLELDSAQKAIDAVNQLKSRVDLEAKNVILDSNSQIIAHSGEVNIVTPEKSVIREVNGFGEISHQLSNKDDEPANLADTRIFIDDGALIDLSGVDSTLAMSDNVIAVELFSNELKDSPNQKAGVLRGKTIYVDIREGTPLADIDSAKANIAKSLSERMGEGGSIKLWSDGDAIVNPNSVMDISGGKTTYESGFINTTKLVSNGKIIDISKADPDLLYDRIYGDYEKVSEKWGTTIKYNSPNKPSLARYELAYESGKNAGNIQIAANGMYVEGSILASTSSGIYQQTGATQAKGGSLIIGFEGSEVFGGIAENDSDFRAPSIHLTSRAASQNLISLDESLSTSQQTEFYLSDTLIHNGIQSVKLASNGQIILGDETANSPLVLADGLSLIAQAPKVIVNQDISAISGSISLESSDRVFTTKNQSQYFEETPLLPEVIIKDGISIDLAGTWSNDYQAYLETKKFQTDKIFIDGGSLSINAGKINIGNDVNIDVSASAHLNEKGALKYGKGGDISFRATQETSDLILGSNLTLNAAAFEEGGRFQLSSPSIIFSDEIANTGGDAISFYNNTNTGSVVVIASDFLRNAGFSDFEFISNSTRDYAFNGTTYKGDVFIKSDFNGESLFQKNWIFPLINGSPQLNEVLNTGKLNGNLKLADVATQSDLDKLISLGEKSDYSRQAMSVSISLGESGLDSEQRKDLFLEQGAIIDVQSHQDSIISLANNTAGKILISGELTSQGGEISLDLQRSRQRAFTDESYVWLGNSARLDVSGTFQRDLSDKQYLSGRTLDGGSILLSSSGYLVTESGSQLFANGNSTRVASKGNGVPGQANNSQIDQVGLGGDITLAANEGMSISGEMDLSSGQSTLSSAKYASGTLTLDTQVPLKGVNSSVFNAPDKQDIIQITKLDFDAPKLSFSEATGKPNIGSIKSVFVENGLSSISENTLQKSNLDNVHIIASELKFDDKVALDISGSLLLEVGKLGLIDASKTVQQVNIQSGYLMLGDKEKIIRQTPVEAFNSNFTDSNIELHAGLIELSSQVEIEDFNQVTLSSDSDIRLRQSSSIFVADNQTSGRFTMLGDLTMSAERIYPVSNTNYEINVGDISTGNSNTGEQRILGGIHLVGGNVIEGRLPILSGNTSLALNAHNILIDTELAAPFGDMTFNAASLIFDENGQSSIGESGAFVLGPNGRLIVSAQGEDIPYGFTVNGLDWLYDFNSASNLIESNKIVSDDGLSLTPSKIEINGSSIDLQAGSLVDISNNGDLYATEFVPGTGGSSDYLASNSDSRFAIIPDNDSGYAAFDQRINENFELPEGTKIVLDKIGNIPAGSYTLLPAEYARLEGAYIVNIESTNKSILVNSFRNKTDGTPVSKAYLINGNSGAITSDYFTVSVRPGAEANKFSEYAISKYSEFIPSATARYDLVLPGNVNDAGKFSLTVEKSLSLQNQLKANAKSPLGQSGQIEISAERLLVGNAEDQRENYVSISEDQLSQLDSGTLLLGGKRQEVLNADGEYITEIEGVAKELIVAKNSDINVSELLLVAKENIIIEDNARISTGQLGNNNSNSFNVLDGAALVAVSENNIERIAREQSNNESSIIIENNAEISAVSVGIDANDSFDIKGQLTSFNGDVSFGAQDLIFTDDTTETGSKINSSLLQSISNAKTLQLRSNDFISMDDGFTLNADSLFVSSPGIQLHLKGGEASIKSDVIHLLGSKQLITSAETLDQTGSLLIESKASVIEGGYFTINGARDLNWLQSGSMRFQSDGKLKLNGQDNVVIDSPQFIVASGANTSLTSTGSLSLLSNSMTSVSNTDGFDLGGKISVEADSLLLDTVIRANSGVISLNSDNALTLADGAEIDVSGKSVLIQDYFFHSDAGRVSLSSQGNMNLESDASINLDVSDSNAKAGTLGIKTQGKLLLSSDLVLSTSTVGGDIVIDTSTFDETRNISTVLNDLDNANFKHDIDIRVRNENVILNDDVDIQSDHLSISSDQNMVVAGHLAIRADDGSISLAAKNNLTLTSTTRLDLSSSTLDSDSHRANLDLISREGLLTLDEGASLVLGDNTQLNIYAERSENDLALNGDYSFNEESSQISGGGKTKLRLIGLAQLDINNGSLTNSDVTSAIQNAQSWMVNEQDIYDSINVSDKTHYEIAPGILFHADSDLTVSASNLDFSALVWGNDASKRHGLFEISSDNSLIINTNISDGFANNASLPQAEASFDINLISGVDNNAASFGRTLSDLETPADFILASNNYIRTGDGDIHIASANNVLLENIGSVIYTAGKDSGYALDNNQLDQLDPSISYNLKMATPTEGGDLKIIAQGNIEGGLSSTDQSQFYSDWLITQQAYDLDVETSRRGDKVVGPAIDAGLWVKFNNFKQGFAAFGGGDLSLHAGGDITRVSASVPTTIVFKESSDTQAETNLRFGQGNLNVSANGNIASSDFFVGDGKGFISSESSIITDRQVGAFGTFYEVPSILTVMAGDISVKAFNDIEIASIFDPAMLDSLPYKVSDRAGGFGRFVSQTMDTSVAIQSLTGDLTFGVEPNFLRYFSTAPQYQDLDRSPFLTGLTALGVTSNLTLSSLLADVELGLAGENIDIGFNPVNNANLTLAAGHDLSIYSELSLLRNSVDNMPGVDNQITFDKTGKLRVEDYEQTSFFRRNEDQTPSLVLANNNVNIRSDRIELAEQTQIKAGRNLVVEGNISLFHNNLNSTSLFSANGNIDMKGLSDQGITAIGPGSLDVIAGGNINLGVSRGFESGSGLFNSLYSIYSGSDMTFIAGASLDQINYQTVFDDFVEQNEILVLYSDAFTYQIDELRDEDITSLSQAAFAYYELNSQDKAKVKAALDPSVDMDKFANAALLVESVESSLKKPGLSEQLFVQLELTANGQALLQQAVAGFTTLPVKNYNDAKTLLIGNDSVDGYGFSDRSKLINLAFSALSSNERIQIMSNMTQAMSDNDIKSTALQLYFSTLGNSGVLANTIGSAGYDIGFNASDTLFDGISYEGDLVSNSTHQGNIDVFFSKIYSFEGGDINLMTPGGRVNGGVIQSPDGSSKEPSELGVVVQQSGNINAFMHDSYLVNQSRAFTLEKGSILMWASLGNIDAGKGAKTAVAIPPPIIELDNQGNPVIKSSSAIAGSGIRQFDTKVGTCDAFCLAAQKLDVSEINRSVNLIAPNGEVNAGDAGIGAAGDINIAAARVVGADNIDIGGASVGVPVDGGGLSASLAGVASLASAASNAASDASNTSNAKNGFGDEALAWLEVFVLGYGEEEEEEDERKL